MHYDTKSFLAGLFGSGTPARCRPQALPELQPKPSDLAEIPTATTSRSNAKTGNASKPSDLAGIGTATPAGCPVCGSTETVCGTRSLWCRDCADAGRETCLGPIPTAGDSGDAGEWLDLPDADGRRCLVRSELAGLEIIDAKPCPVCGGLERWQDLADGWHCERCSPALGLGQQLRERAAQLRERTTAAQAPTWPIAGADAALQLTPDDLPPVPWHIDGLNCCDNQRLLNELRIDLAVIGKGGPHHRSGRLARHIQRLLRVARRNGATPTANANEPLPLPSVEWPAALADFCLLLAPDDLPSVPFKLDLATTVVDGRRYLQALQTEIRSGPSGPRARRGILQDELQRLRVALGLSAEKTLRDFDGGERRGASVTKVSRDAPTP